MDVAVIGAGVVGCAIGRAFARAGREVLVCDAEAREGTGITSRNSGVVHAGLYYPPGSLKAQCCVEGKARLYAWCERVGVPHRRTGKLVVALDADDEPHVEALMRNARANGVDDCVRLGASAIAARVPGLPRHPAALWSPSTGVVDAHALTHSLRADAESRGAVFACHARVTHIEPRSWGFRLSTSRGDMDAGVVVNAAGFGADGLARTVGCDERLRVCRGDYFRLRTARRYPHLIYPIRRPRDPSLGIHLTLELDGGLRLGPDAEWVESCSDFSAAPHKRPRFAAAARRLLDPAITDDQLHYDGCGLRPKLHGPNEEQPDFQLILQPAGCLHLLGIESPGLTAALALGERVVERLEGGERKGRLTPRGLRREGP